MFWAFFAQSCSSATNFGVTLVSGRVLGPGGLGVVFIGFSSYVLALCVQQALLTEPLVTTSPAGRSHEWVRLLRVGTCLSLLVGTGAAAAIAAVGIMLGGAAHGLVLFAPWILPALVQDFYRSALFRDGRARIAATSNLTWLLVMCAFMPVAWSLHTDVAIVAAWGLGALTAALVVVVRVGVKPAPLRESLRWWTLSAWPYARWLGAENIAYSLTAYVEVFALVAIIGADDLGGLRAVVALFAPLSLVGSAVGLPGLPALARASVASSEHAKGLALRLSGISTAAVAAYLVVTVGFGHELLPLAFGTSFAGFTALLWPIGGGQLCRATSTGFSLLLRAQRRGRELVLTSGAALFSGLALCVGLAAAFGVSGAAWGIAAGNALASAMYIAVALRPAAAGDSDRATIGRTALEQGR